MTRVLVNTLSYHSFMTLSIKIIQLTFSYCDPFSMSNLLMVIRLHLDVSIMKERAHQRIQISKSFVFIFLTINQ